MSLALVPQSYPVGIVLLFCTDQVYSHSKLVESLDDGLMMLVKSQYDLTIFRQLIAGNGDTARAEMLAQCH